MGFLIMVDDFSLFFFELDIYCQDRFQKRIEFFAKRVKYFWNKLTDQIKNSNNEKKN